MEIRTGNIGLGTRDKISQDLDRGPEPSGIVFKGREDLSKALRLLGDQGVLGAVRSVVIALRWRWYYRKRLSSDDAFDQKYETETTGIAHESDLTIPSYNRRFGLGYEGTPVRDFARMLKFLPQDLSDFTYVDFGSGKGRTLLLAADFNFTRIMGVEFSEELHAIAKRNVQIYRGERQKCFDLIPVRQDAAKFAIPDGKIVFYFYYPFEAVVLSRVMSNIQASYQEAPRKMFFVFRFDKARWRADCEKLFKGLSFVSRVKVKRSLPEALSLVPYSVAIFETID